MNRHDGDGSVPAAPEADRRKLRRLLSRQDGIVTLKQARACGIHRSVVSRKCGSGEWERLGPSVYRATDHPLTARARIRAAVWSAGGDAVLCGPAAAYLRGLWPKPPTVIQVNVPPGRSARKPFAEKLGPVRMWRRDLEEDDCTVVRNLATTAPALTVLDAAAELGIEILDRSLQSTAVDLASLLGADARYPGRRGARTVAPMLDRAAAGARSPAERRALATLLEAADLPAFALNHPVGSYEVDIAFLAQKLAIEIDGMAYHSSAEAFQHDRTRGNVLAAAGWTVLHFTWADITERPAQTLALIRWHLALATSESLKPDSGSAR